MSELYEALDRTVRQQRDLFFGKYPAFVVDADDPEMRGRCRLTIPSVLGEGTSQWAVPVVPYGGGAGFGALAVPPVGAQVVAEFLGGDPSFPLWTGTFWRTGGEVPAEFGEGGGQPLKLFKTEAGHVLSFADKEGEEVMTLRSAAKAELVMDAQGSLQLTGSDGGTVHLDAAAGTITIADANGNSVELSPSGLECKDASGNTITCSGGGVEIKSSAVVNIEGAMVTVAGSGGEPLIKGTSFMAAFNTHTHATGTGPSSPPVVPMTPAMLTTKSTAS